MIETQSNDVVIKNIYYMLSYSFHTIRTRVYVDVDVVGEEFHNVHNLFAALLDRGLADRSSRVCIAT